jgi:Contractile injection system tube protein
MSLQSPANGHPQAATTGGLATPTGGGQPAAASGLHRARLSCRETGESLDVHYNPAQVTVNKDVTVTTSAQQAAAHGATPQFINTHTRTLGFTLTLEEWSTRKDVVAAVARLQGWMNPTEVSLQPGHTPAPATVEFEWWSEPTPFVGYITQANATYLVFDSTGHPVRATVAVSMHEVPEQPGRQNPTSGTPRGAKNVVVHEGDSLASLAYREYRDPSLWRALALANGITDPLDLAVGRSLLVPAPITARELAR